MATLNLQDTSYSYIVNADGTVTLTAGCDGVAQNPMLVPDISSVTAIEDYITNVYLPAYISGLASVQPQAPGQGVPVGQPQTVTGS